MFREFLPIATLGDIGGKVMAGRTPAKRATLV